MIQALTACANMVNPHDMTNQLKTIQEQRAEAQAELKALSQRKEEVESWLRDLSVTERTLARLLNVDLPSDAEPVSDERPRGRKPKGIPSVFVMACNAIRDSGEEWLDVSDILASIKRRHWPDATSSDISSTLWRLAEKDKRLRKQGTKYALPIDAEKQKEAALESIAGRLNARAGVHDKKETPRQHG